MKIPSILVIDDEPNNFEVIETFLDNEAYELHYAANGENIDSVLDVYNPDILLLDVMMPKINGIEVCRSVKANPKWQAIPIIMVTALSSKSDLANCIAAGADDFIGKPINAVELRARTRSMLRIKQQYDNLQDALKLRQDMVNMVVHDLRNPLTSILLGLEILEDDRYPREKQRKKLSQLYASAQMLQTLIDDLLKIALFESGKLCLNRQEIDLREILELITTSFEPIASQRRQSLALTLPEDGDRKISADPAVLRRAIENILSNASKFSPRGSEISLSLDYLSSGDASVRVADLGPGVPPALQQKIFEKYEIGSPMANTSQIGLGLAFCKMVVEAHDGTIGVSSNQPHGAIFEILLKTAA